MSEDLCRSFVDGRLAGCDVVVGIVSESSNVHTRIEEEHQHPRLTSNEIILVTKSLRPGL
jgi:hypothetical protein